jgi:hypothetical protein
VSQVVQFGVQLFRLTIPGNESVVSVSTPVLIAVKLYYTFGYCRLLYLSHEYIARSYKREFSSEVLVV